MVIVSAAAPLSRGKFEFTALGTAAGLVKVTLTVPDRVIAARGTVGLMVHAGKPGAQLACDTNAAPLTGLEFRSFIRVADSAEDTPAIGRIWRTAHTASGHTYTAFVSTDIARRHLSFANPTPALITHGAGATPISLRACIFDTVSGAVLSSTAIEIAPNNGPHTIAYGMAIAIDAISPSISGAVDVTLLTTSSVLRSDVLDIMYASVEQKGAVSCRGHDAKHTRGACTLTLLSTASITATTGSAPYRCINIETFTNGTRTCTQLWKLHVVMPAETIATATTVSIAFTGIRVVRGGELLPVPFTAEIELPVSSIFAVVGKHATSVIVPRTVAIMDMDVSTAHAVQTYHMNVRNTGTPMTVSIPEAQDVCIHFGAQVSPLTHVKVEDVKLEDCDADSLNFCKHAQLVTDSSMDYAFAANVGGNITHTADGSELCFMALSGMRGTLHVEWRVVTPRRPHTAPEVAPVAVEVPLKVAAKTPTKGTAKTTAPVVAKAPAKVNVKTATKGIIPPSALSWCVDDKTLCRGSLAINLIVECAKGRTYNARAGLCVDNKH